MCSLRVLAALLVCAGTAPAHGAEPASCSIPRAGAWREYTSAHFVVATDVSASTAALLVKDLERTHALIVQALVGEQVEIPGRVRVVALGDGSAFREMAPENTGGYRTTKPSLGEVALVFPVAGGQAVPESVAEGVAYRVLWHLFPRQPRWFTSGLGLFVATVASPRVEEAPKLGTHVVHGERMAGGRWAGLASRELMLQVTRSTPLGVRELFRWKGGEPESDRWRYHAASWVLYHWLWNERSKQLSAFQQRLSDAEDPAAAWRASFPDLDPSSDEAVAKLDAELERYRKAGRFLSYRVDVADADASFKEAPLAPADVHMLLLGARVRWPTDAEAFERREVDEALREDPGNAVALRLRASLSHEPEAAALRRAAAVRPGDWRAWLLLAEALDAKNEAAEKEAAYRKAVALNPDSAHAHNGLAWQHVTSGRAREARPFADRALDLAPWDPAVIDTMAAVAMGIGQCKAAVQLERRAADLVAISSDARSEFGNRLAEYESRCGAAAAK